MAAVAVAVVLAAMTTVAAVAMVATAAAVLAVAVAASSCLQRQRRLLRRSGATACVVACWRQISFAHGPPTAFFSARSGGSRVL